MLLDALQQKPIDWAHVEALVRAFPTWEDAVDEYAAAHFSQGQYVGDIFHRNNRANHLRRALASVLVQKREARTIRQASIQFTPDAGTPKQLLNTYFAQNPETKMHKFKRPTIDQITERQAALPPEIRGKTIFPALPTSGSWWQVEGRTFVTLEFEMPIDPEKLNRWISKYLEEV